MEPFKCHEFNDFLGKPLDAVIGTCVLRGYTNIEKVSDVEMQAKSPHLKKWVRLRHRDGHVIVFGLEDENGGMYNSVKEVPNTLTRTDLEPFLHKEVDTVKEFLQKAGFKSDGDRPQQIGQYRHNAHFFTNSVTNQRIIADMALYKSIVIRIEILQGESKEILDAPKLTRADLEPFLGKAYVYMSQELQKKGYTRDWDVNQNPKFTLTYSDDASYYIIPQYKVGYDGQSPPVTRIELYDGGKKEVIEPDDAIVVNEFRTLIEVIYNKTRNGDITARRARDSIEYLQQMLDKLIKLDKAKANA
jgi:hypothetical protein